MRIVVLALRLILDSQVSFISSLTTPVHHLLWMCVDDQTREAVVSTKPRHSSCKIGSLQCRMGCELVSLAVNKNSFASLCNIISNHKDKTISMSL